MATTIRRISNQMPPTENLREVSPSRLPPHLQPAAPYETRVAPNHYDAFNARPTFTSPFDATPSPLEPPPSLANLTGDSQRRGSDASNRPSSRGSNSANKLALPQEEERSRSRADSADMAGRRRSWLPGKNRTESPARLQKKNKNKHSMQAWIAGLDEQQEYDLSELLTAQPVKGLWDEAGDTLIHLFPRNTNKGASFRLKSSYFSASAVLMALAQDSHDRRSIDGRLGELNLNPGRRSQDSNRSGSPRLSAERGSPSHIYMPITFNCDLSSPTPDIQGDDLEKLVLARNFFAFLIGDALVATPLRPTVFEIMMEIANMLEQYQFSSADGTSFGAVASSSFESYCEELGLLDVRHSPSKTIDAIVLGERMRFSDLYNEGFAHGVGRLEDLKALPSGKFENIPPSTRNRMERAHLTLETRLRSVEERLKDFDFYSILSTLVQGSNTNANIKAWRASFLSMRKHTLTYYRNKYGAWPPNAKSKKNNFDSDGLNRLVLLELYQDFCDLYDLLVNKQRLTMRSSDSPMYKAPDATGNPEKDSLNTLSFLLDQYDRSTPPVPPPIPFDTPLIPTMTTDIRKHYGQDAKKDAKERAKKLKDSEINQLLLASYNRSDMKPTEFIQEFIAMERKENHNHNIDAVVDLRIGQWIFIYAVLQTLPLVISDAPDLRWTKDVEHFLCFSARGHMPWLREETQNSAHAWSGSSGNGASGEALSHTVEGMYIRSHCWAVVAASVADESELMRAAIQETMGRFGGENGVGGVIDLSAGRPGSSASGRAPPTSGSGFGSPYLSGSPQMSPSLGPVPGVLGSNISRTDSPQQLPLSSSSPSLNPLRVRTDGSLPPTPHGHSHVHAHHRVPSALSLTSSTSSPGPLYPSHARSRSRSPAPSGLQPNRAGHNNIRPSSSYNPDISFDDILGGGGASKKGRK